MASRSVSGETRAIKKYDAARVRPVLLTTAAAAAALGLAACGTEGISVSQSDPTYSGAVLFSQRCAGCHTLTPAGTQGSANRNVRVQGPNLDQRKEKMRDVLFAIRNGGFSGAIMPANVVTGREATEVAQFVSKYAGGSAAPSPQPPGAGAGSQ
jgi:mono/diheme cytochrome c family protein